MHSNILSALYQDSDNTQKKLTEYERDKVPVQSHNSKQQSQISNLGPKFLFNVVYCAICLERFMRITTILHIWLVCQITME